MMLAKQRSYIYRAESLLAEANAVTENAVNLDQQAEYEELAGRCYEESSRLVNLMPLPGAREAALALNSEYSRLSALARARFHGPCLC